MKSPPHCRQNIRNKKPTVEQARTERRKVTCRENETSRMKSACHTVLGQQKNSRERDGLRQDKVVTAGRADS